MDPKSRVHAALNRQSTDRVPIWMWYHPRTAACLSAALEVPPSRLAEVMGDDVRQAWVNNNHAMEGIVHEQEGNTHTDVWGICWVRYGPFNQIQHSPLQDADENEVLQYEYPYHYVDDLLANMGPVVAASDTFFVGCDISPCLLEMVCRIRGMERALLDLAAEPRLARTMLERAAAFSLHLAKAVCERFPLDWLWTGDDIGGQQGMIVSPRSWRDMIRPLLADIVAVGKSEGLWVAFHSCGSIRPIIPDLIDIGIDVLNPIQCNCPGMDPLELKAEFGGELTFFGGIDTQYLLPYATADEVYRATTRLLEGMMRDGGGYILGASHAIPPETPLENIFAMYAAAGVGREEISDRAAVVRADTDQKTTRAFGA